MPTVSELFCALGVSCYGGTLSGKCEGKNIRIYQMFLPGLLTKQREKLPVSRGFTLQSVKAADSDSASSFCSQNTPLTSILHDVTRQHQRMKAKWGGSTATLPQPGDKHLFLARFYFPLTREK